MKRNLHTKNILTSIIFVIILVGVTLGTFFTLSSRDTIYTLSIGVCSNEKLSDLKASFTAAAIVTDDLGRIVACRLDTVDYTAEVDKSTGALKLTKPQTKMELGIQYKMPNAIATWGEQTKHFEAYVVGLTRESVLAINDNLQSPDASKELVAGCTISSSVKDFKLAIMKAFDNPHKTRFKLSGKFTLGLAINPNVADNTFGGDILANLKHVYAGVVKNEEKFVSAILDETDVTMQLTLDADKNITTAVWADRVTTMSKLEQGDNYGMVKYGKASAEWYLQAQNYADTIIGKTQLELEGLKTENVSGCTIYMGDMRSTLIKAANNVR